MYYRFVPRVYLPLYSFLLGVVIVLSVIESPNENRTKRNPKVRILCVTLALILFFFTLRNGYTVGQAHLRLLSYSKIEKKYISGALQRVEELHPNPFLLVLISPVHSGSLGAEKVHPLREFDDYTALKIFPRSAYAPYYSSILDEMDLKGGYDFLKWTVNRAEVLFVLFSRGKEHSGRLKLLWDSYYNRNIVKRHQVKLAPVYDFKDRRGVGLVFFQMRSTMNPLLRVKDL